MCKPRPPVHTPPVPQFQAEARTCARTLLVSHQTSPPASQSESSCCSSTTSGWRYPSPLCSGCSWQWCTCCQGDWTPVWPPLSSPTPTGPPGTVSYRQSPRQCSAWTTSLDLKQETLMGNVIQDIYVLVTIIWSWRFVATLSKTKESNLKFKASTLSFRLGIFALISSREESVTRW